MPKYQVIITKTVQKKLFKLPNNIADKIEEKMLLLEDEPRPFGSEKLTDRKGYRIRVGNYRFIYEIFDTDLIVKVLKVGHRKDIYN